MAAPSKIEWTDATWNPVRGCSLVSPGCTNCYAMRQAHRSNIPGGAYEGLTQASKGGPVWSGKVRLMPELLDWPLHRRKPLRIFVNSMSDLFHEDVPDGFITEVWERMADSPQHVFQVLTKRPQRMRDYLLAGLTVGSYVAEPLSNVWLGVSVEDQKRADERIRKLLATPASKRFVSYEPALGPVEFMREYGEHDAWDWLRGSRLSADAGDAAGVGRGRFVEPTARLDWVIVGGESGPKARPFGISWARSTVAQCRAAGVPVFVKQMGSFVVDRNDAGFDGCETSSWPEHIESEGRIDFEPFGYVERAQGAPCRVKLRDRAGADPEEWPEDLRVREFPA